MAAEPHIEAKSPQILEICEKYLASEGFKQENCRFNGYALNITLPGDRLVIVYFSSEQKLVKKSPHTQAQKGEDLPQELSATLCAELWQLFRAPSTSLKQTVAPAIKSQIEPERPPKVYLSKRWYDAYKHFAKEPYIDISPFVNLLKEDYLEINNLPLEIPKDKENDFDFIEQIFLKLNLL